MTSQPTWFRCIRNVAGISLFLGTLAAVLPMSASAQPANEPLPVDGTWTLGFYFDTKPGGETLHHDNGAVSTHHVHVRATKELFAVSEDGKFSWQEPNCGRHKNKYTGFREGHTSEGWGDVSVSLRGSGSVNRERTLQLDIEWTATEGLAGSSGSGYWNLTAYSMSADGGARTQSYTANFPVPPPATVPVTYLKASWTLQPQSIERQETAPDVIREVVKYAGRRDARYGAESMTFPVIQRIEVEQIRQLKLVPRG